MLRETVSKWALGVVMAVLALGALAIDFLYNVFVGGYVIHKLWAWFIVATFHVAALPILAAAGIALLVGFVVVRFPEPDLAKQEITDRQRIAHTVLVFARPWLVLLVGFLITLL
jgi:hypothetical protein